MDITHQTTIAEAAAAVPASVRVFQRYGIDFCCGGKRPIASACEEQGIAFETLVSAIEAARSESHAESRDWSREPLRALIRHILQTYHEPLREELPRLESMAFRVARTHGAGMPQLQRVEAIVSGLAAELQAHMHQEEVALFPAIEAVESANHRPLVDLSGPVAVMEHDHDRAGALLAELRAITGGYAVPEWGCATFRALYEGLAELEAAMQVHVHLENNVLFPRGLTFAAGTGDGSTAS
jgi:regulator of cell morphogenesis and NO signaling